MAAAAPMVRAAGHPRVHLRLLGDVTPDRFLVPVDADPAEVGQSVLQQLSDRSTP
ncbi:hypothetical protein ACFVX6_34145 [Streptomyces sp. NPDC058289]|uniref:hypothetical protein n=1 Tax=Streptomyces sp. NPDC058289 TaxID=3346425 RepID=UPI0036E63318